MHKINSTRQHDLPNYSALAVMYKICVSLSSMINISALAHSQTLHSITATVDGLTYWALCPSIPIKFGKGFDVPANDYVFLVAVFVLPVCTHAGKQ